MSKPKISLGRGLGAILEEVEKAYQNDLSQNTERIQYISIDDIVPNPYQPRKSFSEESIKELSESIKTYGLLQPIIVYEEEDRYVLIAGERRLKAAKLAGFEEIKAIVADIDTKKLRELALIENIQREDLNPIELAEAYKELIENYNITHEELAERLHKSRVQITNTLRLLNLSDETKELIANGKLSQGHAKVLVGLSEKEQKLAVDSIIGQKLNVRETEALVKNIKSNPNSHTSSINSELEKKVQRLTKSFLDKGLSAKSQKNRLTLEFKDERELDFFVKNFLNESFIKLTL